MMIVMDTENAKSMAAACRALAGEMERLPAALGPPDAARDCAPGLIPLLPLMTVTRCAERALLIAVGLRRLASKLDTLPATDAELSAALISDKAFAELMALFDPPR